MTKIKREPDELPVIKHALNAKLFPKHYEVNNQPSETVPDQAMSIHEIMRRFASGLPLGGQRVELYEGEDHILEGINPKTLDLSEIQEITENAKEELYAIQEKHKKKLPKQLSIEEEVQKQLKLQTGKVQDNPEPE